MEELNHNILLMQMHCVDLSWIRNAKINCVPNVLKILVSLLRGRESRGWWTPQDEIANLNTF